MSWAIKYNYVDLMFGKDDDWKPRWLLGSNPYMKFSLIWNMVVPKYIKCVSNEYYIILIEFILWFGIKSWDFK